MKSSLFKENRMLNSQRKISNYIKSTLGNNNQINDSFCQQSHSSLNELESQLQNIVRVKTQSKFLQEIPKLKQTIQDKQAQLIQTGNFGHPESRVSQRRSTQRTLPAFDSSDNIPQIGDLRKFQNFVLDQEYFEVEYMDELKKLSSIIMFRLRNIQRLE